MMSICNPFYKPVPDFDRLYIFGAGGYGREIAWFTEQCWGGLVEPIFLVDRPEYLSPPINGVPVQLLKDVIVRNRGCYVTAVGDVSLKKKAVLGCSAIGLQPISLIHPRVEASRTVRLSEGSVICAGTILTVNIDIGCHVHVNLDCTIGHNVSIGDYATLSPGVHVSGHVAIGTDVFIGTGVNIINGKSGHPLVIGDGAVIAAGACVTKSVEAGALVAGVPALRKR
jgi:sugar O-acyltransferase (sialic acid O-acetyltransferase NeuD family)